ncbi:hypothetical protein U9M48_041758 [Paspalum notatum var. saurae]|uniref:Uncharacterized protein n=1 Tax=Paspalum notatum var. saurae TaxID=547442 RepID=A0AAQ3UPQ9_PASNO
MHLSPSPALLLLPPVHRSPSPGVLQDRPLSLPPPAPPSSVEATGRPPRVACAISFAAPPFSDPAPPPTRVDPANGSSSSVSGLTRGSSSFLSARRTSPEEAAPGESHADPLLGHHVLQVRRGQPVTPSPPLPCKGADARPLALATAASYVEHREERMPSERKDAESGVGKGSPYFAVVGPVSRCSLLRW